MANQKTLSIMKNAAWFSALMCPMDYPGLCRGPFVVRPPSAGLLARAWSMLGSTNLNTCDAPNRTFIPLCSMVVSEMRCPSTYVSASMLLGVTVTTPSMFVRSQ